MKEYQESKMRTSHCDRVVRLKTACKEKPASREISASSLDKLLQKYLNPCKAEASFQ